MEKGIKNNVFKSTFWSLLSRMLIIFVNMLVFIFITRTLTIEDYGYVTLITSIVSFLLIFSDFGISPATAYYIVRNKKEKKVTRDIISKSYKIIIIVLFIISVCLLLGKDLFIDFFNIKEINEYILLIIGLLVTLNTDKYLKKVFEGIQRLDIYAKLNLYTGWLPWLLMGVFVFYGFGAKGAILGQFIGYFISNVSKLLYLKKKDYLVFFSHSRFPAKKLFAYGRALLITSAAFYIYTQSDILMIQYFLEVDSVALYGLAIKVNDNLHIPAAIFGASIAAYFGLYIGNKEKLKSIFLSSTRIIILLYLPMTIGLFLLAKDFVPSIFGEKYVRSSLIVQIYTIQLLFFSLSSVLSLALDYIGKAKLRAIIISISAILNVLLNLYMIPNYGVIGAAVSTIITYVPTVVIYIYLFMKQCNISVKELVNPLKRIIFLSLVMGILVYILDTAKVNFIITTIIAVAFYTSMVYFLKLYKVKIT